MKQNWWKAIASFLMVLFTMPLGHALMMIMEKTMTPEALHYSAFLMGLVGLLIVITGVFVKGDTKQTIFSSGRDGWSFSSNTTPHAGAHSLRWRMARSSPNPNISSCPPPSACG